MKGWKTWMAAAGIALTGATEVIGGVTGEGGDVASGVNTIFAALALVGIGHKVEKSRF